MGNRFIEIKNFIIKGIWSIRLTDVPAVRAFFIRTLRILILSLRGINEDKIQLRASALTLYSILSVVPVLAMGFGIAKGFGFEKYLEKEMYKSLAGYEDVVSKLIDFANSMLARTQGGLIAGIGLGVLFFTVMKVFSNVETSFNDIWQVKKHRSFVRKFTDYLSMMLISPIFIVTASAVNVYMYQKLEQIHSQSEVVSLISPLLISFLNLLPYFLIIILFTLVYIIMPNTKVKLRSALIAGVIAGSAFQITQWGYIHFQIGVSNYNAIYGSFAALPLFIVWLQVSWLIVLVGAKISYSEQNVEMYEFETETKHMSDYSRRMLSLVISHRIIKDFRDGHLPPTAENLSHDLKIPLQMIKTLLYDLVKCRIVSEILLENKKLAYQPAHNIDHFSIKYIIEKLDCLGETYESHHSEVMDQLENIHRHFFETIEKMPENILLKDL
jgi:membrane protein